MSLKFSSFASGSSGNSYLVKSENTTLLVDVGITGKRIFAALAEKNIDPAGLDGILITHEHIDHVRSLRMIAKKATKARVYASGGTLDAVGGSIASGQEYVVRSGEPCDIGDIRVIPFDLSHDAAEPKGYTFISGGRRLTIVTDTGCISPEIEEHITAADLLVLEANHEVNILKMGSYPYNLKRRILGDRGHLSNETAGEILCGMLRARHQRASVEGEANVLASGVPKVVLAHLSRENNTPGQAYLTIRNILFEADFYIDKDLTLAIADRDEAGPLMEV
ncbi:MBL fold metallo-hydrolase [Ihubacter sp. mB4P-1]|uniref:MBL fold metallo-hydrolase n=1 Tax=Ihubacter sp. mB4P-1 TaxID=3242370 RepID=UPI00137B6696